MELGTEVRFVLVAQEAAGLTAGALDQNSARRTNVHGIEVITILDVGRVGKAELLVDPLLLLELLVILHCQRDMVDGSCSERPASGGTVRLVMQD
jgi:hypothetical protein